jgi:hypothetical protein
MKRLSTVLCTLLLPASLLASALPAQAPARPAPPGAVIAIDGRPISGEEYGTWLVRTLGEKLAREYALRNWIVDREAKRVGVDVGDEAVAREVEKDFRTRVDKAFAGNRADWLAELARTGRSEAGLRRQREVEYRPDLQAAAIASIDRDVPPEKIVREWETRYGLEGRRYDLRGVFFKVVVESRPEADRAEWRVEEQRRKQEMLERARAIRARALAGEDFGKLALENSMDPETRDRRGAFPSGFTPFNWVNSFQAALALLSPGDVSEPLYARGGWWVLQVRGVQTTPFESVAKELEADLIARGPEQDEVGRVFSRLAQGVKVRVLPSLYEPRQDDGELPSALEPALEVDGEAVSRGAFARWILHTRGEASASHFAEEWLVRTRARELGVTASEEEVLDRVREHVHWLLQAGNQSRETWVAYLTMSERSEESFLRELTWRLGVNLLAEKMMLAEREVTDEQVRARYDDEYGKDGIREEVSMILVPIDNRPPEAELSRDDLAKHLAAKNEEARQAALKIVERAQAGEDFAALARECSRDGDTAAQGGRLPGRFRADTWHESFGPVVATLAVG